MTTMIFEAVTKAVGSAAKLSRLLPTSAELAAKRALVLDLMQELERFARICSAAVYDSQCLPHYFASLDEEWPDPPAVPVRPDLLAKLLAKPETMALGGRLGLHSDLLMRASAVLRCHDDATEQLRRVRLNASHPHGDVHDSMEAEKLEFETRFSDLAVQAAELARDLACTFFREDPENQQRSDFVQKLIDQRDAVRA